MKNLNVDSMITDKINFCVGVSNALQFILLNSICNNDLSEEKCNCFLALSECLNEKLNLLSIELKKKV